MIHIHQHESWIYIWCLNYNDYMSYVINVLQSDSKQPCFSPDPRLFSSGSILPEHIAFEYGASIHAATVCEVGTWKKSMVKPLDGTVLAEHSTVSNHLMKLEIWKVGPFCWCLDFEVTRVYQHGLKFWSCLIVAQEYNRVQQILASIRFASLHEFTASPIYNSQCQQNATAAT